MQTRAPKVLKAYNFVNDFTTQQGEVWDQISKSPIYSDRHRNLSGLIKHVQLVNVRSEDNVRVNEQHLVEIPAKEVLNTIHSDEKLRHEFKMPGEVTLEFESRNQCRYHRPLT